MTGKQLSYGLMMLGIGPSQWGKLTWFSYNQMKSLLRAGDKELPISIAEIHAKEICRQLEMKFDL